MLIAISPHKHYHLINTLAINVIAKLIVIIIIIKLIINTHLYHNLDNNFPPAKCGSHPTAKVQLQCSPQWHCCCKVFFHFLLFCCQLPGTSIHPSTFFHPSYHFVSFKHSHFSLSTLNSFLSFILLFILLSLLASIMRTAPLPPQCSVKPVSIPDIYRYRCRPSLCQHFPLQQQWENLAGASQQSPTGRRLRPGYFPIKMFFI